MSTPRLLFISAVGVVALLLLSGFSTAATGKMGTAEGEDDEPVLDCEDGDGDETEDEDCVVEARWNPVVSCQPGSGDDIYDLLACLVTSESPGCRVDFPSTPEPPDTIGGSPHPVNLQATYNSESDGCIVVHETGNYVIAPLDQGYGFTVLREDGSEIEHLYLLETVPGIKWTEVAVDQDGLMARIASFVERPTSGTVTVWLNERTVEVDTWSSNNGAQLTRALENAIREAGFSVMSDRDYLYVTWDHLEKQSLRRLGLGTTDSAIIRTELALESSARPDPDIEPLIPF